MPKNKGSELAGGDLQALRGSEIGGVLATTSLGRLARAAMAEEHARDATVYERGSPALRFWVVCSGRVRVTRAASDGREVVLAHRHAGAVVGEWGLFGNGSQEDSASVSEPARLLAIPVSAFKSIAEDEPRVAGAIVALAAARRLAAEETIEALTTRSVRSRIAQFLVEAAKRDGSPDPRGVRIRSRYTHLEIACTVGATRETTTVTLDEMKRKGLLIVERRRLIVRDVAKLRASI